MWVDNPLTAYIVLGLGNLLGGVTKGVTGFGSAILNLCTWIIFVVAGVQSGTLQQAVICEALSSTLIAPGLLYVTRAHATADLKMVAAISLFVALSSPLGAAILAKLDSKRVELVMAAALLLIIVAEQLSKLVARLSKQKQRSSTTACRCSQSSGCKADDPCAAQDCDCFSENCDKHGAGCATTRRYAGHISSLGSSLQLCAACEPLLQTGRSEQLAAAPAAGCQSDCVVLGAPICLSEGHQCQGDAPSVKGPLKACNSSSSYHQGSSCCAVVEASNTTGPTQQSPCSIILDVDDDLGASAAADQQISEEQQALLPAGHPADAAQPDSSSQPAEAAGSSSSSSIRWRAVRSWLVVLGVGSIAGSLSGIMEGLTGMNGPPIMFMYRRLNTPKATVRGNNAFLNLLQMRLVPYWYMGLIVAADVQLYGVACAAGVVGVLLGDRLSHFINQQAFQQTYVRFAEGPATHLTTANDQYTGFGLHRAAAQ